LGLVVKIKKIKGFTLIELIIVMAIIGIVAVIATFAWRHYVDNANLHAAARDLASDITYTRQRAVAEGVHYRMTISTLANNYTIEQRNIADTASTVIATKSPTVFGLGLNINSVDYNAGNIIAFEPRGIIAFAGSVILKNSRNSLATITSNTTGKTYVTFVMH
jgi:prepilin-type N-terminal cleavage/methylation domain-containing protein